MRREKIPDAIRYGHCDGSGIRKDVLATPFSLCWVQHIEFENNKKKKNQNQRRTKKHGEN